MKKILLALVLSGICVLAAAQEMKRTPVAWKWVSDTLAVFSYDGSFDDGDAFGVDARSLHVQPGVKAPERFADPNEIKALKEKFACDIESIGMTKL